MKLEMIIARYPGDTGEFLRVDPARCSACGDCARFCVRGVWHPNGSGYHPDHPERCAECGACWNACPAGAVLFGEPRGGTGVRFTHG